MQMLETTMNTKFIPGTNLTGGLGTADWRFLLPSLELETILCIGVPTANMLATLSAEYSIIAVISSDELELSRLYLKAEALHLTNVHAIHVLDINHLPFHSHSVRVIFFAGSAECRRRLHHPAFLKELHRILQSDGTLYADMRCGLVALVNRLLGKRLWDHRFEGTDSFWLTPLKGDFRTAVPLHDRHISAYFFKNVLYGQSFKKRFLSSIGHVFSKCGVIGHVSPYRAVTVKASADSHRNTSVPDYIVDIARQAGVDLTRYRFGLSARGKHNANKLIFFLFPEGSKRPDMVVKMTRSRAFNLRLENEHRILQELYTGAYVKQASFPKPLFFGYHNNLALLGLKAVEGNPFRIRTTAAPDCPIARDAADWICRLGGSSAGRNKVSSAEVCRVLDELLQRFRRIYTLSPSENHFLCEQINAIRDSRLAFPLVFQHGDPGTWNILVSRQENIVFIDWEAGELKGMPLWDLFYFMRSFAIWIERNRGHRDSLKNMARHFLAPSEVGKILIQLTEKYCSSIHLDKALVKPLFFLCWMHRALKESTRLRRESLPQGTFIKLLELFIEQHNAPALTALFLKR
jgi:hypothetical protein